MERKNRGKNSGRTSMIIGAIAAIVIIAGVVGVINNNNKKANNDGTSNTSQVDDYVGKNAKQAYEDLKGAGYDVKFQFDRSNNGGFTDEGFQNYVLQNFESSSYSEMPFVVTGQSIAKKVATLKVDYSTAIDSQKAQAQREEALEKKLGIVESMTACQQYGNRNYRDFKMHSILGKIAEYASDDDTWFLKYKVDANGYNDLTMECSVTGSSQSPTIKSFTIY